MPSRRAPPLPILKIDRLDLLTGQRQPWREIALSDPARVRAIAVGHDDGVQRILLLLLRAEPE